MSTRSVLAVLALIAVVLLAGCLGARPPGGPAAGSGAGPVVSTPTVPPSADPPAVLIVDPPFDGGVAAWVTVSVRVTGFAPVPPGGENREGAGHPVHYRDVPPPTGQGSPALAAPGTHTFAVRLVNADEAPLEPPALDAVDATAVSPGMVVVP